MHPNITSDVAMALTVASEIYLKYLNDTMRTGYTLGHAHDRLARGGFVIFSQQWSHGSMGFGGMGVTAFVTATTCVFYTPEYDAIVTIGSRYAYTIPMAHRNKKFQEDVSKHKVVGKQDFENLDPYGLTEPEESDEESSRDSHT